MIVIRSVGRAETIRHKTIKVLLDLGTTLPIRILVKSDEYDDYIYLEQLKLNIKVMINPLGSGIKEQNKLAFSNFGKFIAYFDDDISRLTKCLDKKNETDFNFDDFFSEAISLLDREQADIYTIEHTGNLFFTKNQIVKGLYTQSGFGIFRCEEYLTNTELVEYEDFHRCLKSFSRGIDIIKDCRYSVKHNMSITKNKGGMNWNRTNERLDNAKILAGLYPDLVRIVEHKKYKYNLSLNKTTQKRSRVIIKEAPYHIDK